MTYRETAVEFCCYSNSLYSEESKKIDFIIADNYINYNFIIFYFNYEKPFDTTQIIDELNCGLKVYKLKTMCGFYMRLNNVECKNFNMCWTFFSYNILGRYYRYVEGSFRS